jgi:hypothetical protein
MSAPLTVDRPATLDASRIMLRGSVQGSREVAR